MLISFNIFWSLVAAAAIHLGAANKTISTRDVTESQLGGIAVTPRRRTLETAWVSNNTPKRKEENMSDIMDGIFVIEQPDYKPTVGEKTGKFIDMKWDLTPKKNVPRKDLILTVELDEKDEVGNHVKVEQTFNMLHRGRGTTEFKKQMSKWLGRDLTPVELAGFQKAFVLNKPVIVNYKLNRFKAVAFDGYLPVTPTEPTTAA